MLKPEAPSRASLGISRFSRNGLAVVVSLLASCAFGMAVAGSKTGLVAVFLDLLVISSLLLSPVCAKRSGYRFAIGIGAITILSVTAILGFESINSAISLQGLSVSTWAFIQIAIIKFAYNAHKENKSQLDARELAHSYAQSAPIVS